MNKMNKIKVSTNLIDQIRMSKIYKPSIYFRTLMIFFLITICPCFFLPKLTTRFCYNSSDPARVNSQCVYCNYYHFDSVLLGCTGSSALTINITATQAFCVISQCLGQIRQAPVFLGRRRKRELEDFIETGDLTSEENSLNSFEQSEESKSTLNDLSSQQLEQTGETNSLTTNLAERQLYEEEIRRKDALVQQEALDSLNLAAYRSETDERAEDEVLETTTEIIEFNLNGEQNKYIVKKEIQAIIVDVPELFI